MSEKRTATDQELKDVVKAIADTETLVSELQGGFSFDELAGLVRVANDLPVLAKDANVIIPEWSALDDAARADLVSYVQLNCKYPASVTVEAWTEKVLCAAVLLSQIYQVVTQPPVQPL